MKNHSSIQDFLAKIKKLAFTMLLLLGLTGLNWINSQTTVTFSYTGGAQSWIVPACVTSVDIEALGAQGGSGNTSGGGLGGKATGTMAVVPGQVLNIYVGGAGANGDGAAGGFNGGGTAACCTAPGSGGGASDIRTGGVALANRAIVAGGGGGGGGWVGGGGGGAGGLIGNDGGSGQAGGGGGGTQVGGGVGGGGSAGGASGAPGILGTGGTGGGGSYGGGGGGGGYYGGGAGGGDNDACCADGGGGGGGSSYIGGVASGATMTGVNGGNGQVKITYTATAVTITCPANINVTAASGQCTAKVCFLNPTVTSSCAPLTPAGYIYLTSFGNSYYYRATGLSNYATAESNAIAAGGHLAVITSAAENAAIAASGAGFAWMGGNDLVTNGVWKWANCEAFSYSNFCPGEPNGGTFENHLEFEAGGCWNDLVLTSGRYGLLEIEGAILMQTGGLAQNAMFPVGITTNTYQATDAVGNTATCSFTVSVSASSCKTPIQVYHIDTTATTAKVKWKAPTGVNCTTGYELRIRRQLSPGVWTAWSIWTSPSGTFEHIFLSLMPSSFYNYQIHTKCGPNKNSPDVNDWFFTLGAPPPLKKADGFVSKYDIEQLQVENNSLDNLPANLVLVPNPAKDFTTILIEGFSTSEKTVTLFDLYGKLIFNVKADVDDNLLELDLTTLNVHTGVYLVRVSDGKKQKTTQLMIER